jgi:hypothetical protein
MPPEVTCRGCQRTVLLDGPFCRCGAALPTAPASADSPTSAAVEMTVAKVPRRAEAAYPPADEQSSAPPWGEPAPRRDPGTTGRPSLAWPILLGFLGALIAASRARRAGLPTGRYWKVAALSVAVSLAAAVALPVAVLAVLAQREDDVDVAAPDVEVLTPVVPPVVPPVALTPRPEQTSSTFTALGNDGTRVTGTVAASAFLRGRDADGVVAAFKTSGPPCPFDRTRDAVILATFTFQNETPDFDVEDFVLGVTPVGGVESRALSLGLQYSAESPCLDHSQVRAVRPKFSPSSPTWGPVTALLVARDVYTPALPAGDEDVLRRTVLRLEPTLSQQSMSLGSLQGALTPAAGSSFDRNRTSTVLWSLGKGGGDTGVLPSVAIAAGTRLCVDDTTELNLRDGPGLSAAVLAQIPVGSCDVVDTGQAPSIDAEGRPWRQVAWQGRQGWVSNRMLARS